MMKSSILYTVAGVGDVLLLGIGFLLGHVTQKKPEVLPEAEPLFQTELARQGAEYLTDLGVQRMQTQSDMNLCTITAAVLREAELFGVFRSYLASLPEAERPAAIRQQIEWQKKYREEIAKPSPYEGGSMAPMERALTAQSKVSDRIAWLTASPENRAAYERMKNLPFVAPDKVQRKLTDGEFSGVFRDGEQEYFKLLPEFCRADGDWLAGLMVCNIPGRESFRMITIWKNGEQKEKIRVARITRVDTLRFQDGRLFVSHTKPDGSKGSMSIALGE